MGSLMEWNDQLQEKLEFFKMNPGAAKFVKILRRSIKQSKASKPIKRKSIVNKMTAMDNEFQSRLSSKDDIIKDLTQTLKDIKSCNRESLRKENADLKFELQMKDVDEDSLAKFAERYDEFESKTLQEWVREIQGSKELNAEHAEDLKK